MQFALLAPISGPIKQRKSQYFLCLVAVLIAFALNDDVCWVNGCFVVCFQLLLRQPDPGCVAACVSEAFFHISGDASARVWVLLHCRKHSCSNMTLPMSNPRRPFFWNDDNLDCSAIQGSYNLNVVRHPVQKTKL